MMTLLNHHNSIDNPHDEITYVRARLSGFVRVPLFIHYFYGDYDEVRNIVVHSKNNNMIKAELKYTGCRIITTSINRDRSNTLTVGLRDTGYPISHRGSATDLLIMVHFNSFNPPEKGYTLTYEMISYPDILSSRYHDGRYVIRRYPRSNILITDIGNGEYDRTVWYDCASSKIQRMFRKYNFKKRHRKVFSYCLDELSFKPPQGGFLGGSKYFEMIDYIEENVME